jgi:hypothetical protein
MQHFYNYLHQKGERNNKSLRTEKRDAVDIEKKNCVLYVERTLYKTNGTENKITN